MASSPTEVEINKFKFITRIHILLVKHMGRILVGKDYSDHDKSKFEAAEMGPYILKFIRHLSNDENLGWRAAVTHHYHNNNHHAQYWIHHNQEMPRPCIEEAVVDMLCAKLQYEFYPEIEELVRVNAYDIDENKLVEVLNEKLKDKDLYSFHPRFLEPYTDDDKLTINEFLVQHKRKMLE